MDRIFVPFKELASVIGFSWTRQHVANLVKQGRFPRPVNLSSQRVAWRYTDLLAWAESRGEAKPWQDRPGSGQPGRKHKYRVPLDK
jgi:predicted DNA-binding transcriptional regulator AlpA